MKRILHISTGNLYGGVEVFHKRFFEYTPKRHEHEIALFFKGRQAQELRGQGIKPHFLGEVRFSRPWTVRRARQELLKLLKANAYDLVIIHSTWSYAAVAPTVKAFGIPVVLWNYIHLDSLMMYERFALRQLPDRVFGISQSNLDTIVKACGSSVPGNFFYLPVPFRTVPQSIADDLRSAHDADTGVQVILNVGRLEPGKGQRFLIEALGSLKFLNWQLWMDGKVQRDLENDVKKEIVDLACKLEIEDRIHWLENPDVMAHMKAADVLVHPNIRPEGFGLVLVEALSQGCTVIASNCGAAPEIVDDSVGRLVEPGRSDLLRTSLMEVLADSGFKTKVRESGPARAAALCNPKKFFAEFENIVDEMLQIRGTRKVA